MTSLSPQFIRAAQRDPITVLHRGVDVTLRDTNAAIHGLVGYKAELAVVVDGDVVGYITPYSEAEHGAVKASGFGVGMPALFRDLEGALDEILQ